MHRRETPWSRPANGQRAQRPLHARGLRPGPGGSQTPGARPCGSPPELSREKTDGEDPPTPVWCHHCRGLRNQGAARPLAPAADSAQSSPARLAGPLQAGRLGKPRVKRGFWILSLSQPPPKPDRNTPHSSLTNGADLILAPPTTEFVTVFDDLPRGTASSPRPRCDATHLCMPGK